MTLSLADPEDGCNADTFEGTNIRVVDDRPDNAAV